MPLRHINTGGRCLPSYNGSHLRAMALILPWLLLFSRVPTVHDVLRTLVLSLFSLVVTLSGAVILAVIGAAIYFSPGLPDVRQLQDFELHTPLRIFTNDGKLIGEFGEERRMAIDFDGSPGYD